jgi:exodeoxyribonuclease-3
LNFLMGSLMVLWAFLPLSCHSQKGDNDGQAQLRIITHNVWYGFTRVPERKAAWLAWIKAQDPDIVALQELNGYTPEKLAEDALNYGHGYSALLKTEGFPTGITSRLPIEDIQRTTEGFHHGLLRVRIRNMYVYVIHLHPSNWEGRTREIELILQDIRKLPDHSEVLLAGDFNTFSPLDSIYYAHGRLEPFFHDRDIRFGESNLHDGQLDYTVIQQVMDDGLVDLEASMRSPGYRFSGSFPTMIEKDGEDGDPRRLDYIFASGNLANRVSGARIISSDTVQVLSDHLPVVVDIHSP